MSTITIDEAEAHLAELIDKLPPGGEIVITRDQVPIAKLTAPTPADRQPRQPGTLKGTVLYMAPDFNAAMNLE